MKSTLVLGSLLSVGACADVDQQEVDYLGQLPPGDEVSVFAPGIVTSDQREHGVPVFSADGREVYFVRQYQERHDILWARTTVGVWRDPEPVPFASDARDDGPAFFPGEGRLFFGSARSDVPGGEPLQSSNIWYVTRVGDSWGAAEKLAPPINTEASEGYPSFTSDGTMYFHSGRGGDATLSDIYRARWLGESFAEPERLPLPVNSELYEAGPYVAPDESFLIYLQVDQADPEPPRLNLTFRGVDDTWTEPVDLAHELNLPRTDLLLGRVSPDGKYLFILADGDVYWVDAGIIAELDGRRGG